MGNVWINLAEDANDIERCTASQARAHYNAKVDEKVHPRRSTFRRGSSAQSSDHFYGD